MFENLRSAFREAVENFKEELSRDEVPEAVDRLLVGMRNEVVDAKARLRDLEEGIERARREAEREKREAATCARREKMAREIGDEETARVAAEYRERHERRREVLDKKGAALEEELTLRRAEIEEMLVRIKEARERREELAATAGRGQARGSISDADDLFAELDRMAEKIGDEEAIRHAEGDVAREFDDRLSELHIDFDDPPPDRGEDVDARLAELKRRMGKE